MSEIQKKQKILGAIVDKGEFHADLHTVFLNILDSK